MQDLKFGHDLYIYLVGYVLITGNLMHVICNRTEVQADACDTSWQLSLIVPEHCIQGRCSMLERQPTIMFAGWADVAQYLSQTLGMHASVRQELIPLSCQDC